MTMHVLEGSMLGGGVRTGAAQSRAWGPRDVRWGWGVDVPACERRSSRLELVAIGLDHRTAGIELRERVAFANDEIPAALGQLTDPADPLLEQAAILSTCNRVELYGVARTRPPR